MHRAMQQAVNSVELEMFYTREMFLAVVKDRKKVLARNAALTTASVTALRLFPCNAGKHQTTGCGVLHISC